VGIAQGGTDVGAPIKHMIRERIKADVFIGITDNVDWAGDGFLTNLEEYRKKVNGNLKCFLVTIAPYRDGLAPMDYPDVYCTYGWSDAVLKYIGLILSGGVGQVDDVKAIDLSTFGQKAKAEETVSAE
jgi:60 kDa SS-A/Ro ribonucleoprotein